MSWKDFFLLLFIQNEGPTVWKWLVRIVNFCVISTLIVLVFSGVIDVFWPLKQVWRFLQYWFTMNSGVTGGATIMALLMVAGVWWVIRRIRDWLGF